MYFYLFRDVSHQWRWNFYAANNRVIASSSESYHNKQDALDSIQLVRSGAPNAPTKEST